ncbi:MAG: dynamin family protein [Phycisphaeraceae bacterium]|nr:dynamin family protein [Phycisphaeraceae bacterium]
MQRHALTTLEPRLAACRELLASDAPLDIAVLGQFKSGKSSLLNALLADDILPVGVLPVTAVITRLRPGPQPAASITRLDGAHIDIPLHTAADYIAESANPENAKGVSAVDISTPNLADLPGIRLVDTPGLGSIHAHNTQSTLDWLPSVALALVAISVERPLSEEDLRLIRTLQPIASRVVVVLTKTDLLTEAQVRQVRDFIAPRLRNALALPPHATPQIIEFSTRRDPQRHLANLRQAVLAPFAANASAERAAALNHKLLHIAGAAREYLEIALKAAEKAGHDRQALLHAVLDDSIAEPVISRELSQAASSVIGPSRAEFEGALLTHGDEIQRHLIASLAEMKSWRGHLGVQTQRYQSFMQERVTAELAALAPQAGAVARRLLAEAERRFRRIAEAFRDRLSRNVSQSLGISFSPIAWEPSPAQTVAPPVTVDLAFMSHWDLFWWLLPMPLIGGLFRSHCRSKVPWEVWINLRRYAGAWYEAAAGAIESQRDHAAAWIRSERATLHALLTGSADAAAPLRASIATAQECAEAIEQMSQAPPASHST